MGLPAPEGPPGPRGRGFAGRVGPFSAHRPELLATYIASNREFIAEHPAAIRAVIEISANARTGDGTPLVRPADVDDPVTRLAAMFRDGQQAGEFRTFDPTVMAVTLRAAIDAAAGRPDLDPRCPASI